MSSDSNPLDVSPEFAQISNECELLKEELAALFVDWEQMTGVIIPNLEADYIVKIGTLQYELLQIQIEIQRTKREIAIRQAANNKGEKIDDLQVNQQLEQEFYDWKVKLDAQMRDIKDAELRLSSLMSLEDSMEIRKLYRLLAKKLHPDVNPDQSQEAKNLWLQVQSAYDMSDLKQLQVLHLLAEDIPDNYDLPSSIELLRTRRSNLKEQIMILLAKIAQLKSLPIFKWEELLNNREFVAEEQRLIREQIEQARKQLENVVSILNQMKKDMKDG